MIELTLEQYALKTEVERYLDFEVMHYEITQTQLERDLLELYALHGMKVAVERVRELAEGLEAHRAWQEDSYDGSSTDKPHWWREGPEAGSPLPDPDPSTYRPCGEVRPGG